MANSKAKKKRLKQQREQGKDVTIQRNQVVFSTHVRMTKTKQESLNKLNKKHKRHFQINRTDSLEMPFLSCYINMLQTLQMIMENIVDLKNTAHANKLVQKRYVKTIHRFYISRHINHDFVWLLAAP